MPTYWSRDLVQHLIIFQALLLANVLANSYLLRRAGRYGGPRACPLVSILVPARNEERGIERCIRSLLAQEYPHFQVLVLDDQSTDGTASVLEGMAHADARLQVLQGQPLPPGWVGKNWACAQLAARAEGELLFFTDADTVHQPQALRAVVAALQGEGADLLTGFPRQLVGTWGERLIVPFFSWATYCFTPLGLAYRIRLPGLCSAVGQMMLFRRGAYEAIGGHAAVCASVVEDIALARRVVACGYRWRVLDATRDISCRMYGSGREAYAGLTKNLFAAFEFRLLPYLFAWLWLAVMFLEPPVILALCALGLAPQAQVAAILACIGLSLALWLIPYRRLGLPLRLALLYPLTVPVAGSVALRSLGYALAGRLTWKGRALAPPRWRWL